MAEFLPEEKVQELIVRIKENGDNDAWLELFENYQRYIKDLAKKMILKGEYADKQDLYEELVEVGQIGMWYAIKNFHAGHGKFITYATSYVTGEMKKELAKHGADFLSDSLSDETVAGKAEKNASRKSNARKTSKGNEIDLDSYPDLGGYSNTRTVIQILDMLRMATDQNHPISKSELREYLQKYRVLKYGNNTKVEAENTITTLMDEILKEMDPLHYENNDDKYRIKYKGYKEDYLDKKINKKKGTKAPSITDFYYNHTFDADTLDRLIQIISFTDIISDEEKNIILSKLLDQSSRYYTSPFWKKDNLAFNPKGIYSRFAGRDGSLREGLSDKLQILQDVINHMGQISFHFDKYDEKHNLIHKYDYVHTMSPYHLVVYHDNYYCIGLQKNDKRPRHFRVDLMSDIEILRDENGERLPMEICKFDGLPIFNDRWNPQEYMAQHINMGFDDPKVIRLKVSKDDETRYTALQDWFGDEWELTKEKCDADHEIIKIKTSPYMIVHWAMQYGNRFEVLNEDIREKIREEIKKMEKVYERCK